MGVDLNVTLDSVALTGPLDALTLPPCQDVLSQSGGRQRGGGRCGLVKEAAIRVVHTTPIDDTHVMAQVEFSATARRPNGDILDLNTSPTYLLATWRAPGRSSLFWVPMS